MFWCFHFGQDVASPPGGRTTQTTRRRKQPDAADANVEQSKSKRQTVDHADAPVLPEASSKKCSPPTVTTTITPKGCDKPIKQTMTNIFQKQKPASGSTKVAEEVTDLQQKVPECKEQETKGENDENEKQGQVQTAGVVVDLKVEKQCADTDVKMENDPTTPLTQALEEEMNKIMEPDAEERLVSILEEATKCQHWEMYVKHQAGDDAELIEFYQSGVESLLDDPEAEARTWLQFVKAKGIEQTYPLTKAYLKDIDDAIPKHPRLNRFIADKWEGIGKRRNFCELLHWVQEDIADFEKWLADPDLATAPGDSYQTQTQPTDNDETQESRKDETQTENDENIMAKFQYPPPPSSEHPNINHILKSAAEALHLYEFEIYDL